MAKTEKVTKVAEIADQFRGSTAAVVTEYRGLTMAQITTLRKNLGSSTAYTVAKNTLVKRAAFEAGVTGLDDLFTGPTAVAFISGEPVDAAKALRDFAKTNPLLVIKGGLLDGRPLDAAEVVKLADLESREVLLGKLAGAMLGTLTKAAVVLNALPSKMAQLAAALVEKISAETGETVPAESDQADADQAETAPVDASLVDAVPADADQADAVPVETAPVDASPVDAVPADADQADAVPAETAPVDAAPVDAVPADADQADAVPAVTDQDADVPDQVSDAEAVIPAPTASEGSSIEISVDEAVALEAAASTEQADQA